MSAIIECTSLSDGTAIAGSDIKAVLVIDAEGRVFQVIDGVITNGIISQVTNARTAIIDMLDQLGVRDLHAFN